MRNAAFRIVQCGESTRIQNSNPSQKTGFSKTTPGSEEVSFPHAKLVRCVNQFWKPPRTGMEVYGMGVPQEIRNRSGFMLVAFHSEFNKGRSILGRFSKTRTQSCCEKGALSYRATRNCGTGRRPKSINSQWWRECERAVWINKAYGFTLKAETEEDEEVRSKKMKWKLNWVSSHNERFSFFW